MTTASQVIVDGSRNLIIKTVTTGASDVTDEVVIDVSTLAPAASQLKIMEIEAALIGCSAILEFDATADDVVFALPEGEDVYDFRSFGGIPDPLSSGTTGDIVITTTGLGAGDTITLIIKAKKKELA